MIATSDFRLTGSSGSRRKDGPCSRSREDTHDGDGDEANTLIQAGRYDLINTLLRIKAVILGSEFVAGKTDLEGGPIEFAPRCRRGSLPTGAGLV